MKERKKKAMLIMPLIIAPFAVFIFWVLGLVGPATASANTNNAQGINMNLPAAVPSADSSWDKLHFYEAADKDSAKLKKLRRQDPYLNENKFENDPLAKYGAKATFQPYPDAALNEADDEEKKVYEKISAIHREMNRKPQKRIITRDNRVPPFNKNNEVDRLEQMMEMMNNKEPEPDPEMVEIQQLMESIKDIQHPERIGERLKKEEVKSKVFDVDLHAATDAFVPGEVQTNRFYSTDESHDMQQTNGILAVVHETQKIAVGDLVKMRLSQNIFINSHQLDKNSFIYGAAKINANRIMVHVSFVQVDGEHFPVSLDVIGHDGMPGIAVMASKAAMAASQTADRVTQGMNMAGVDNLGAQVAGAVIQTGKQLFKKQTKVVQYQVPAGYQVQLVSAVN